MRTYLLFFMKLMLTALLIISFSSLKAQEDSPGGLAGPDKHTCKINGITDPVKIGPGSAVSDWCYSWSPADGLNDPRSANPSANPDQTTTYTLKVVFDDFSIEYTDQVTVIVDEIQDFTISPKQCCFKKGEKFTPEKFEITTDPPGNEKQVYFEPDAAPTFVYPEQNMVVTAKIRCDDGSGVPISKTVSVKIINEDILNTVQFSLGPLAKGVKAMEDIMLTVVEGVKKIPGNPCPPSFGPQVTVFKQTGLMCCPDTGCPCEKYKFGGNYKVCGGTTCEFPIPGASIPGIAAFNVVLLFNACIGAQIDYTTKCDGGDFCVTGLAEINLGGGVSGTVLNGAAARVSGTLVSQITAPPVKICFPSGKREILGSLCYQLDGVLTVNFLSGMAGWQWKVPVIPKVCMEP